MKFEKRVVWVALFLVTTISYGYGQVGPTTGISRYPLPAEGSWKPMVSPLKDGTLWSWKQGTEGYTGKSLVTALRLDLAAASWKAFQEPEPLLAAYLVQDDPYDSKRLWLALEPSSRSSFIAYDRQSRRVLFEKQFNNTQLTSITPGPNSVWLKAQTRVLQISRSGQLLKEATVPYGLDAPTFLRDGLLLFQGLHERIPSVFVETETGSISSRHQLGGYQIDGSKRLDLIAGDGNVVFFNDGFQPVILVTKDGRSRKFMKRLSPSGVIDSNSAWIDRISAGHHAGPSAKGFVKIDIKTLQESCIQIEGGVVVSDQDEESIWFLFNGGLGKIDKKGVQVDVLDGPDLVIEVDENSKHRLFSAQNQEIWIAGQSEILRLEKSYIEKHLVPYSDWYRERLRAQEDADWSRYTEIAAASDSVIYHFLQERSRALSRLEAERGRIAVDLRELDDITLECKKQMHSQAVERVRRFEKRFIDQPMLKRLPTYSNRIIRDIVHILSRNQRVDAVPALRKLLQADERLQSPYEDGVPYTARRAVNRALIDLGDRPFLEELYAEELSTLATIILEATRNLKDSRYREGLQEQLHTVSELGGEEFLARRLPTVGRALVDNLEIAGDWGPIRLSFGEEIKVVARVRSGGERTVLIAVAQGVIGIIVDERLVQIGPVPTKESLVDEIDQLWDEQEYTSLIRPLHQLRLVEPSAGFGNATVPCSLAKLLTSKSLFSRWGSGEGAHGHSIERIELRNLVGDAGPEVVVYGNDFGYEWGVDTIEIWNLQNICQTPERVGKLVGHEVAVGGIEHRPNDPAFHFADVDDDEDLEIIALRGVIDGVSNPADTWVIDVYDFDGLRFVDHRITNGVRDWLRNRYRTSDSARERTIIRSHFGGDPPE